MIYGIGSYGSVAYGGRRGLSAPKSTTIVSSTPSVVLSTVTETIIMRGRKPPALLRARGARITLTTIEQNDVILPSNQGDEPTLL